MTFAQQTFTLPNGIGGSYNNFRLFPYSAETAIQVTFSTPANFVQIYKDNFPTPAPPDNGTVFMQVMDGLTNPIVSIPDLANYGLSRSPALVACITSQAFTCGVLARRRAMSERQ